MPRLAQRAQNSQSSKPSTIDSSQPPAASCALRASSARPVARLSRRKASPESKPRGQRYRCPPNAIDQPFAKPHSGCECRYQSDFSIAVGSSRSSSSSRYTCSARAARTPVLRAAPGPRWRS